MQNEVLFYLDGLLSFGAPAGWFARVRIRLVGRSIFSNGAGGQIYLDGQTFGEPGSPRADGSASVGLQFPSGNGAKASDFESWFYLAPVLLLVSVTVNFTSPLTIETNLSATAGTAPIAVTPTATVTINYPPIAIPTTVALVLVSPAGSA